MTTDCPNEDYFSEWPYGLDENCVPIDPCTPSGTTELGILPCEYTPETTIPVVEQPVSQPVQMETLPATGGPFIVGLVFIAIACMAAGKMLLDWARDDVDL